MGEQKMTANDIVSDLRLGLTKDAEFLRELREN